jgi:hypothetical protein
MFKRTTFAKKEARSTREAAARGSLQTYDHTLPGLADGSYTISASSNLADVKATDYQASDLSATEQHIIVSGPRFTVEAEDIHALFPAANSAGAFALQLPHLIFTKPVLPWERLADANFPWLALLLFREDELQVPEHGAATDTRAVTTEVSNFLRPVTGVLKPNLTIDNEEENLKCQYIQLSIEVFKNIVPYMNEFKYLSHCRRIANNNELFSVIVANRFPKAPEQATYPVRHLVHLVSLEGLKEYLQTLPEGNSLNQYSQVQLLSLMSWGFYCTQQAKEDIATIMANLVQKTTESPALLRLKVPNPDSEPLAKMVAERTVQGYVSLWYQTRTAEQTVAWYRGPLTPVPVNPLTSLPSTSKTGRNLTIYDEEYGVFDLSYAAAWQIGRLLALADSHFTQALMQLRTQKYKEVQAKIRKRKVGNEYGADNLVSSFMQSLQGLVKQVSDLPVQQQPTFSLAKRGTIRPSVHECCEQQLSATRAEMEESSKKRDLNQLTGPSFETVSSWLKQHFRLENIPFSYLVANSELLPLESIKFFYIDSNWLNCLMDGALSIGVHIDYDTVINQEIKEAVKNSLQDSNPKVGFLLRSTMVSGWTNLTVKWHDKKTNTDFFPLYKEQLAADVLFCLYENIPDAADTVIISQPHEQLTFGVRMLENKTKSFMLRKIVEGNDGIGSSWQEFNLDQQDCLRETDRNVLNIGKLITKLASPSLFGKTLTPAELALQMAHTPAAVDFEYNLPVTTSTI